jgi:autophagy-related protein 2
MDLHVGEVSPKRDLIPLLVLTSPRSLVGCLYLLVAAHPHETQSSVPRPMVKARFISFIIPETSAKETKIRLNLWGFTYHVHPDLQWISDVGQFVKTPPGVCMPFLR